MSPHLHNLQEKLSFLLRPFAARGIFRDFFVPVGDVGGYERQ
jgi:hypothetical protein